MSLASILDRLALRPAYPRRNKRRRPARFHVEVFEDRVLLTTYTVNSTDHGLGGAGVNTLVEAIGQANADTTDSNPFVINFAIPTSDPGYNATTGVWTIALIGSGLPIITHPVVIDATTQPGYKGQPLIDIDGTHSTLGFVQGLEFHVGGNTVKGLDITNFENFGIVLDGSNDPSRNTGPGVNNIIQANFIGTDGENAEANLAGGIDLVNSSCNQIGGLNAPGELTQGNLISGNGLTGIFLSDQGDTHNYIEGNYIGTDASGLKALPNGSDGIFLGPSAANPQAGYASNNFIGGTDAANNNVISGNQHNGVYILGGINNDVAGNYIGLGADGVTPVPNSESGVRIEDASQNLIGGIQDIFGTITYFRNVISANRVGVEIRASQVSENGITMPDSTKSVTGNRIQGNLIGTDVNARAVVRKSVNGQLVGVQTYGVSLFSNVSSPGGVFGILIGGAAATGGAAARNVISGNGIGIKMFDTSGTKIQGNFIGSDTQGTPAGNDFQGIQLTGDSGALVGSESSGDGGDNFIADNGADGVLLFGTSGAHIVGNLILANGLATNLLPNDGNGVQIDNASGTVIGGTEDWMANTISGNGNFGVLIAGSSSTNNQVQRNRIGVGSDGSTPLPNKGGVRITGALQGPTQTGSPSGNLIGGTQTVNGVSLGNIISANQHDGVDIDGGATLNQIVGNWIGTNPQGANIGMGNGFNGVAIFDSSLNIIGGATSAAGNVIVNNGGLGVAQNAGVLIQGQTSTGNNVLGNDIGIGVGGVQPQGNEGSSSYNGGNGVLIDNAPANIIGGSTQGARNVISGNSGAGVRIQGAQATANLVTGNYVGSVANGSSAAPNHDGVEIADGAAANIIGQPGNGAGNLISGNSSQGVLISQAGSGNVLENNYIGPRADGTAALPNGDQGVKIVGSPSTRIGGDPSWPNVISGNTNYGIAIGGALATGTLIKANDIGTDSSGAHPLGNGYGIVITAAGNAPATQTTITQNVISGNLHAGIGIFQGAYDTQIEGNFIGTDSQRTYSIPNLGAGIEIDDAPLNSIGNAAAGTGNVIESTSADPTAASTPGNGAGIFIHGQQASDNKVQGNEITGNDGNGVTVSDGATSTTIGGGLAGELNVISGNGKNGVAIVGQGTRENDVDGNYIGVDSAGKPQGNKAAGVLLGAGASDNLIGGLAFNVISANLVGVQIQAQANSNAVFRNYIGADPAGGAVAGFGNTQTGVVIVDAFSNTIGAEYLSGGAYGGNAIVSNGDGIDISGAGAYDNRVEGNVIEDNTSYGVDILLNPTTNEIGGDKKAAANQIAHNGKAGVYVESGNGNAILHNPIFGNGGLGIDLAPEGVNPNLPRKEIGNGPNNLQNHPVLTLATSPGSGFASRVVGYLESAPSTVYTLEFFAAAVNGDARRFVGSTHVQTNASGIALFDAALPDGEKLAEFLTATATDPGGNTSELSPGIQLLQDSDGDGIPDNMEGSPDSQLPNVVNFQEVLIGDPTLVAPQGTAFTHVTPLINPSPDDAPAHVAFDAGLFSFQLTGLTPGQAVNIDLLLPAGINPNSFYRYGPTPDNRLPHWYPWMYTGQPGDGQTGAEIKGNQVVLHFVDGGLGDDDLSANGTIVVTGGPGFPSHGPFTVNTTLDSGLGSLRQAILNANANPGADVITFDIPGPGPFAIQPLSALPAIATQVTIDGTSQPGYAGTPLVEIDGSQAGPGVNGLVLDVQNSTIQGLAINRFSGDGLLLNSDGSYNTDDIRGNYIGTDVTGTTALANGRFGIEVNNVTDVLIGDSSNHGRNVISANAAGGIFFHGSNASENGVENDLIGTQADGVSPLGNGGPGVLFDADADYNAIGPNSSTSKQPGNTIAFNAGPGVQVAQAVGNHIRANSMFSNSGGGIDLAGAASSNAQSSPVLTSVAGLPGAIHVTGTVAGTPSTQFILHRMTLDFYASAALDPAGVVEGQTFLGTADATTDTSGNAAFDVTLAASVTPGSYVTATATDNVKGTSPFSAALQIPLPPPPTPRVFTVNTTDDVNDAVPDPAHFSLREAILAANSNPGLDTIRFNLPDQNRTIVPLSPLPIITDPVIIDGTTQPGYQGLPLVELDGSQAGTNSVGLNVAGGGSIVRGLVIHNFYFGLELNSGGGNRIEGNFLGYDVTGTNPDTFNSLLVGNSPDNLIGGTTPGARNLINVAVLQSSGNRLEGNDLVDVVVGGPDNTIGDLEPGAANTVAGNLQILGHGNVVQGNQLGGVTIGFEYDNGNPPTFAYGNVIGGTTAAARNIIGGEGVALFADAYSNVLEGNYIGTDDTGMHPSQFHTPHITFADPYVTGGVYVAGFDNTIGGSAPGAGNLISGWSGLPHLGTREAGVDLAPHAHGNVVEGNLIGTDVTGTTSLANDFGIISAGYGNRIGGSAPGAGNVISGNFEDGLFMGGPGGDVAGAGGNIIQGNRIGTDVTGTKALGNGVFGSALHSPAFDDLRDDGIDVNEPGDLMGGVAPGAGNIISGNAGNGISVGPWFVNGGAHVVVQGNYIGTDVTGTSPLGNRGDGISFNASQNALVGGTAPGAGNLISANGGDGVRISATRGSESSLPSTGNVLQGNKIGTDVTGTRDMGNAGDGISIMGSSYIASNDSIGGTAFGAANIIAYNGGHGVSALFGSGNSIRGNDIFANAGLGIVTDINGVLSTYAEARAANVLKNLLVLTSAVFDPQGTVVDGTLTGTPFTRYDIDLFANDAVAPSGFGPGQTFLESISVLIDETGSVQFQVPLDLPVRVGQWITATVTDAAGSTSEFSRAIPVVAAVDASAVQLSAPAYLVTENGGAVVMTVTRTGSTAGTVSVDYATVDGSATAGVDYTAQSGMLEFNDGEASKTLTIPIQDDGKADGNKNFRITLSNPTGTSLGALHDAAVTIADDNTAGQVAFASGAVTVMDSFGPNPGTGTGPIVVTRTGGSRGRITVDYRVTGGTAIPIPLETVATESQDYADFFGTLTFEDGQTTAKLDFIIEDNSGNPSPLYKGPVSVEVTLGNPTGGATLGAINKTVVTIRDDDERAGGFAVGGFVATGPDYLVDEGTGPLVMPVSRTGNYSRAQSVDVTTVDGTAKAGINYLPVHTTLLFQPGDYVKGFDIPILRSGQTDPGTFQVVLSNPTDVLHQTAPIIDDGHGTAEVQIFNSTGPGHFSIAAHSAASPDQSPAQVAETAGSVSLVVERLDSVDHDASPSSYQGTVTVDYATSDGTAKAGTDYAATSGTLTFHAGETEKTIRIPVFRDDLVSGDKTFSVTLSNPTGGATIDNRTLYGTMYIGTATVTIYQTPGQLNLSAANYVVAEAKAGYTVTVSLDYFHPTDLQEKKQLVDWLSGLKPPGTITVDYSTQDGTAQGGIRYTPVSGTLTFSDGAGTATFTIPILNDTLANGNQTVLLTLSNPTGGATIGPLGTATLTILDEDVPTSQTTTTTLTSDFASGAIYGQTVNVTAVVAAASGTPTGSVHFVDQSTGQDLGSATLAVVNGVDQASIRATGLTAGTHTIVASYTSDSSSFENSNVSFTQLVVPATLTITADPQTKIYGDADPDLTYQATGFKLNDTAGTVLSGALSRATGETVAGSPYAIGQGTLVANTNYAINFTGSKLTITPATLTVTADNKTKVYGQANLPMTDTITGFVNGDTASVVSGSATLSTTATTASGVGKYSITVGQGTLSAANYTFALVNGVLTVNQDSTTTTVGATVFGLSVTFTATVTANAPGGGTPTGSVDFFDTTTNTDLGSVVLSAGSASLTATLPDATQRITANYQGDANFIASTATTSVTPLASVYVLSPSASGALAASGNASIQVPGVVVDDSSSSTAITANGNVKIAAGQIDVVGSVRSTGHASFSPTPVTGHAVVPDPYRNLAAPSGGTSLGDISLAGNSSFTIHPGVYGRINVSGNAKLTMTSGVYVIAGGGFSVSSNAGVSGTGVMIYDAGGNDLGGSGFGSINMSGNGQVALTAPATGPYAGVLFFQSRDNTQGLTLSGNAVNGLSGTIYAANAPATLSGNATLNLPMVVNTLTLSGNAVLGDPPGDPPAATTALSGSGLALSGFELSPLANVPVATFTSSDSSETASAFTATIDWGDGSSSPGAVTLPNDQFTVSGSHTYGDEGNYSIVVSVSDGQASTTIAATAKVAEELLAEGTPGTADQRFISEIYRDVLGRQAEPQGRDFWVSHLARGDSRAKVVQDILAAVTEEYHRDLIRSEFDRYLHRAPDPTAMRFFTSLLDEGGDATMLDAIIVSSPEYFQEQSGTLNQFVDALFHDALGRPVDPAAAAAVETRAAQGATRAQIADVVFTSEEYRRDLVGDWYHQYLDRAPDAAGMATYTSQLDAGLPDEHVIAALLSSNEFVSKLGNGP